MLSWLQVIPHSDQSVWNIMLMWLWDVSIKVSSESLPRRPFDTLLEMLKNHCIVKHFPCRLLMSRSIFRNAFHSTWVNTSVWKMPRSDPDDSRCQINRSLIGLRASVLRLIGWDFDSFGWQRGIWISSRQKTGHSCSFQIDVRLTSEWRPWLCSAQMCFVHRLFQLSIRHFLLWIDLRRSDLVFINTPHQPYEGWSSSWSCIDAAEWNEMI